MRRIADRTVREHYAAWREADELVHDLAENLGDALHPLCIKARAVSDRALRDLLESSPPSVEGAWLKLKAACRFEDFVAEAADPACGFVAPRLIVSALRDLEALILLGGAVID